MDSSGGCSDTTAQEQQHAGSGQQLLDAKQQIKYILPPIPQQQVGLPSLRRLNRPTHPSQRPSLPKPSPPESFVAGTSFAMASFPYSNPYGQSSVYATAPVPQYTQAQIDSYYQQYQCYPPQPYQIIADYYAPSYVQPGYGEGQGQQYAYQQQLAESQDANKLAPPLDEETLRRRRSKSDRRSRSGSRTR
ncbi:hypothetical protein BDV96DRAFT_192046 [Lophiotrema nucula]|uniref:Uncharacterized protein n=1 Tax=Lophiotrema nucula TaxID=690887 RepID=A0A6A5YUJ7_9PLEO|nr:hypothetical protein BDV96DRAFT_192046 [Lophiotrema nucula]